MMDEDPDYYQDKTLTLMNVKGDMLTPKIYGVEDSFLESVASEYYFPEWVNNAFDYDYLSTGQ